MTKIQYITADEFYARYQQSSNMNIIDVRTEMEHAACHVAGTRLFPLQTLDPAAVLGSCENGPLYLLCKGGARAEQAAKKLSANAVCDLYVVQGGTDACVKQGNIPMNIGKAHISLERQVRIAAGFLVVLGVLLAAFLSPAFIWMSAFVGAGLVFAGITDTCAMGMLIARMPWNKA